VRKRATRELGLRQPLAKIEAKLSEPIFIGNLGSLWRVCVCVFKV
jgi:hypothetical protein